MSERTSFKRTKMMEPNPFEETSEERPLPYTCICYGGLFKVTDSAGMFTMPHETDPNKTSLFRCCEDETDIRLHENGVYRLEAQKCGSETQIPVKNNPRHNGPFIFATPHPPLRGISLGRRGRPCPGSFRWCLRVVLGLVSLFSKTQ